ncbi:hypothetical protein ANANG_G00159400 [Anguilla anguilla]|uniref:Thyroglobulin type-1 domain-containing protein n=1 Tax=Anguilla anguilla TaxID=7936 RepID=A0A9D3RWI5_ANGAN|nr:hypothetical protein ANANG_G00159400 [Anguilla anguilla]
MPEQQQHQPLLSSQTSVNMGPDGGDSTKRALKVAGITVLACALIAGQALTAYFLLSQKSQINALEDSANSLKKEMVHRQSGSSSGMAMHLPMSSMSIMTDDTSEDPKPKDEPSIPKLCVQQAVEAGPDDFRPQCDEQGNFLPMQCNQSPKFCWCVNPLGQRIPGTARPGKVFCGGTSRAMSRMAAMPSMMEMKDE